jgi:hypothetical protein
MNSSRETTDGPESCGMVCCGYVWDYWPILFEDGVGHALTVNADRYVDMMQNFLMPELHT